MEAGYDYLLMRGRLQRRFLRYTGIFVFFLGAALLATSGAYYGYAAKARADLDSLNVTSPGDLAGALQPEGQGTTGGKPAAPGKMLPALSGEAISGRGLYPGEALEASAWSNPLTFEPPSFREQQLLQGFTPVEFPQYGPGGGTVAATRLIVPAIGVDSSVSELAIVDLAGSRAYETPDKTVGHIPESGNPGETGSGWFFGHTESPTLGEGSVFFDLRRIPEMLRRGEDVYIITDNGLEQFLYRAVSSEVVHQNDFRLYDTGMGDIHLVSCVPRLVYDHRLVVTGELIAQKSNT